MLGALNKCADSLEHVVSQTCHCEWSFIECLLCVCYTLDSGEENEGEALPSPAHTFCGRYSQYGVYVFCVDV